MTNPHGPGSPFTALFDEQTGNDTLPTAWAKLYSPWPLPQPTDRPYVYVNFVTSRDGRVSFNIPGHMGGGDVSRRNLNDRWLMGLLRARADGVLVGATSLLWAGNHIWTPEAVFPEDAAAWADLRLSEGRTPQPLQVVITRSGKVDAIPAPVFNTPELPVLLATTRQGLANLGLLHELAPHVAVYAPDDTLDLATLFRYLHTTYGVRTLLSEAGPQVYGSLQAAQLVDDEFVTLSPILIGNSAEEQRPGLVEGVAFGYADPPSSKLLSVHQSGDYLFLHSRYI